MTDSDRRVIEDFLPIQAISAEASREKSVRKGHISTLHLWWARRPLVACRAAVYGALVPASRFMPENGPDNKKQNLGRANAAKFVERLCKYPGDPVVIQEAQRHILEAHADRLTRETGQKVRVEDIEEGRAPPPKVLDMFAGGGAIPLEALRLGCEAYALDLNPVAHIIELCTLVYPQKYGKPDPNVRGATGPENAKGHTTWGGLATEVRYWGAWVLEKVRAEIGDLYPLIPDPEYKGERPPDQTEIWRSAKKEGVPPGYLVPIAYLWTRTVRCKNPSCGATVPLVRQTWLCNKKGKKKGRHVALKVVAPKGEKRVRFEVLEATTENGFGFDPAEFSKAGNATCPFCGTVADSDYVKAEGQAGRLSHHQLMAIVCTRPGKQGKIYLSADDYLQFLPDDAAIQERIEELCKKTGLTAPDESMDQNDPTTVAGRGFGISNWSELFTSRQLMTLLTFLQSVHGASQEMTASDYHADNAKAIITYLALVVSHTADWSSSFCHWTPQGEKLGPTFTRQAIVMVWDFAEINPLVTVSGGATGAHERMVEAISELSTITHSATVARGTATNLLWNDGELDAVVTDPPYYDNISYAVLSDFFYVWLKRLVGQLYPEHFSVMLTPKKGEAIADATRHNKDFSASRAAYENLMLEAFIEAGRVLKPRAPLVCVYAHKTTIGWATLVDALRQGGFEVTEAWPVATERPGRPMSYEASALASSIFLGAVPKA